VGLTDEQVRELLDVARRDGYADGWADAIRQAHKEVGAALDVLAALDLP
jgi:hypothetical protein